MLRDPKDVASPIVYDQSWMIGGPRSSIPRLADIIRADRAAVIAEAKLVLIDECGGHGDTVPTCCDRCAVLWRKVRECVAALDDILKET